MDKADVQLTGKEQHFCEEYILDYNQTAAAIRAGYPEKSAAKKGSLLMKRPDIRAYILQLQKERRERLSIQGDFVLAETLDLLKKCKKEVPVKEWNSIEHKMMPTGEHRVLDSKGATRCLELLAKMVGSGEEKNAAAPVVYITDDLADGDDDG